MKISQVAAQLFTLRDHIKTPKDITDVLRLPILGMIPKSQT